MADVNPKHKPLHRIRNIRNAKRSASLFPQLAKDLFTPTYAINHPFDMNKEPWAEQQRFLDNVIPPKTMAPQPDMREYYQDYYVSLEPTYNDFDDEESNEPTAETYSTDGHPPGFVGIVTEGLDQGDRMIRAGLNPGAKVPAAEMRRRAKLEAAVQRERNKITMKTIKKEGDRRAKGKKKVQEAFPGLKHHTKPVNERIE